MSDRGGKRCLLKYSSCSAPRPTTHPDSTPWASMKIKLVAQTPVTQPGRLGCPVAAPVYGCGYRPCKGAPNGAWDARSRTRIRVRLQTVCERATERRRILRYPRDRPCDRRTKGLRSGAKPVSFVVQAVMIT